MTKCFSQGLKYLDSFPCKARVVVPMADDSAVAFAIKDCLSRKLITKAFLIGDKNNIQNAYGKDISNDLRVEIISSNSEQEAIQKAISLIKDSKANMIMRGKIPSSSLINYILDKSNGLRHDFLSHVSVFLLPNEEKFRMLTDSAVNKRIDEAILCKEIENARSLFTQLYDSTPKIALLAANEKVSDKVPATRMAESIVAKIKSRTDLIIEGPVSFDLSISEKSANIKKYKGEIRGDADILVAPHIETSNALYKSMQHMLGIELGSLIFGADCPIVYPSFTDGSETKLNSLLLGLSLLNRN